MPTEALPPDPANPCFGCGAANPRGLKLAFELDREARRVRTRWTPPADLQGAHEILHGGIIALVFDEAMGKLGRLHNARAVTAELSVAYLKPVVCESEIMVEAWESRRDGRNLFQEAELRDQGGNILARAHARFVILAATTQG